MSMILLEPANTITHFNVEIKRRTISLMLFLTTILIVDWPITIEKPKRITPSVL
jgi:hypothetical protein